MATLVLQLAPILILVFLSLLSSWLVADPLYSLDRTSSVSFCETLHLVYHFLRIKPALEYIISTSKSLLALSTHSSGAWKHISVHKGEDLVSVTSG